MLSQCDACVIGSFSKATRKHLETQSGGKKTFSLRDHKIINVIGEGNKLGTQVLSFWELLKCKPYFNGFCISHSAKS